MLVFILLVLSGCGNEAICSNICEELVVNCSFESYPSVSSCERGCLHSADQSVDIQSNYTCILESECDLFKVVECENVYGSQ